MDDQNTNLVKTGVVVVIAVVFFYSLYNFIGQPAINTLDTTEFPLEEQLKFIVGGINSDTEGLEDSSDSLADDVEYATVQEGTGDRSVEAGDRVSVTYVGQFEDGEVFDRSPEGEVFSFSVGTGQVIRGFDEVVIGMKVGEIRYARLEPSAAYGEEGAGPIPPNTPLIFIIQLVTIE